MRHPRRHSVETITAAREQYQAGRPRDEICAALGISASSLYAWLNGKKLSAAMRAAPVINRVDIAAARSNWPSPDERMRIVSRLWRIAVRQVAAAEKCLDPATGAPADAGSGARALATLARAIRELESMVAAKARDGTADEQYASSAAEAERADLAARLEKLNGGGAAD